MSMSTYRVVWMAFMVFIVAPAFVLASSVEGLDFSQSVLSVQGDLYGFWVPSFIGDYLAYPVTMLATILPGTSSMATFFGEMIWSGVGLVMTIIFFINFEPPFYTEPQVAE